MNLPPIPVLISRRLNGACSKKRMRGFTLIELLTVVMIISILAAIGYPSYTEYVKRSILAEAPGLLTDAKMAMDQFYLSRRTFTGSNAAGGPCVPRPGDSFAINCVLNGGLNYTLTATGNPGSRVDGFTYAINQSNTKTMTTTTISGWPIGNFNCWLFRKGDTCG